MIKVSIFSMKQESRFMPKCITHAKGRNNTVRECASLSSEHLPCGDKQEKYNRILPQVQSLCDGEDDLIAKMANVAALLHSEFDFWWTGFYRVSPTNATTCSYPYELLLGPFQGPLACVHIPYGKGVCGTAWKEQRAIVVPDVELFPGHIACSSQSRSEIVVPLFLPSHSVVALLDIDSRSLNAFDDVDLRNLQQLVGYMV